MAVPSTESTSLSEDWNLAVMVVVAGFVVVVCGGEVSNSVQPCWAPTGPESTVVVAGGLDGRVAGLGGGPLSKAPGVGHCRAESSPLPTLAVSDTKLPLAMWRLIDPE